MVIAGSRLSRQIYWQMHPIVNFVMKAEAMKIILATVFSAFVSVLLPHPSFAQSTTDTVLRPPVIELEVAGRNFWVMPKNDVWTKLDADQKRFVEKYVKAMQSGNVGEFSQLVLPESVQCLRSAPEELRKKNLDSIVFYPMQGDSFSLAFEPYVQKFDAEFAKQLDYWDTDPVANTHTFLFGFTSKQGVAIVKNHKLIKKGSDFYIILGCPTKNSIKMLEDTKVQADVFKKGLSKALEVLTTEQRDTLYDMVSKAGEEPTAAEYEKMHPEFKEYARGVAAFLKKEFMAKLMEKTRQEASKPVEKLATHKAGDTKESSIVSNQSIKPAERNVTEEEPHSNKLIKMAALLALIFAVSVLLLRVLRRNDPKQ
jgi:hypothetical protein